MNTPELIESVSRLVTKKDFTSAEELLVAARTRAVAEDNSELTEIVLSELVDVLCLKEPPDLNRAEAFLSEIESLNPSAKNKLKMAMFSYQVRHDPAAAERMLREAITRANKEQDYKTAYFALSVLGTISLDKASMDEATSILRELERIISDGKAFVAGDEAGFLEKAVEKGLDARLVNRIAENSLRVCRDPAFRRRLENILEAQSR